VGTALEGGKWEGKKIGIIETRWLEGKRCAQLVGAGQRKKAALREEGGELGGEGGQGRGKRGKDLSGKSYSSREFRASRGEGKVTFCLLESLKRRKGEGGKKRPSFFARKNLLSSVKREVASIRREKK